MILPEISLSMKRMLGQTIDAANREAYRRILAADPVLADVRPAAEVLPGMAAGMVLHSGPPVDWARMCGPTRGAVAGALVFEGWAPDLSAAERLAASGEITLHPNHHFDAVGPMTGITTPSMPLLVVENRAFGARAFCTINEGMGNVLRFGGNDQEVVERLRWLAGTVGPALASALRGRGGIPLKGLVARGLTMGDEMHMRNAACSSLLFRELAPSLAREVPDARTLAALCELIAGNDMFFLNVVMAMAKSMVLPAQGIEHCTVVTTMCRNGTDFGVRLSGTGDTWFTAPAGMPQGLYFPGFGEQDANPDMGDSCIVETVGLGGFAMAASPAVVGFLGAGSAADAVRYTRSMYEITVGQNPEWTIPFMDFAGVPTGIDARKVLATGLAPVINTAIAHREPGRGQVGAGIVRAPMACFEKAIRAVGERAGL